MTHTSIKLWDELGGVAFVYMLKTIGLIANNANLELVVHIHIVFDAHDRSSTLRDTLSWLLILADCIKFSS
jgi:hypothetical protein